MKEERKLDTLRAAVAGCGGIASLVLDAAGRSPDFEVVALMDPDPAALARAGEAYGVARRHSRFEELLDAGVDFVVLNGPNHVHLPQVGLAAAAGKHCLVQKPMARDAAEAAEMVALARKAGVRLGVVMFELGKPLHHEVRAMIDAGWPGEVVGVDATGAHGIYLREPPPEGDWRRDPAKVGGGAFLQLAVHHLNLAVFLTGREVAAVAAGGAGGHTVFPDETTVALARFEDGLLGTFRASYATDLYSFEILGTRGRVRLTSDHVILSGETSWQGEVLDYETPGQEVVIPIPTLEERIAARRDGVEVHGAFARWVRDGGEYASTGERGLADMRVVMAVHQAREEGRWVDVER